MAAWTTLRNGRQTGLGTKRIFWDASAPHTAFASHQQLQGSQLLFQFLLSSHDLPSSLNLKQLLKPHRALARLPPSQAPGTQPHLSLHPKESHAARPTSLCEEEDQEASPSYRAASRKFFVQYNHFASSSYAISILLFQRQLFRLYLKLLIHFVTDSLKTQISWSLCDKQLSEMYLFYKLWEKN